MLIQRFFAPEHEVADLGLHEINMPRLGRFVALAGKNGAGKSRILSKLEFYVTARLNGISQLPRWKKEIINLENALKSEPNSVHRPTWERSLEANRLQIEHAIDHLYTEDGSKEFKAVRFVPKELELQDPRKYAAGELESRFSQAKLPGLNGYEQHCLFYIQQLQTRWWNADHHRFSGTQEEKTEALLDYDRFQIIVQRLLGVALDRNLNGNPTLFGKPIADAGLSDGQKVILQLCVALHAQHSELDNTIFLLDEPENHLHPSAAIDLLKSLYEATEKSQIWIATHSVPLLAYIAGVDPMSLWYVEDGGISNAGRHPEKVLNSLLGDEERIGLLNSFTGLPAHLAAINYATESLFPPKTVANGEDDPQVSQIQKLISQLANGGGPLNVLDFGAGQGRLLDGLAAVSAAKGERLPALLDYFAFDQYPDDRDTCQRVIRAHFPDRQTRYFNSCDDFFSHKDEESIDVVVMCNVLHEISPHEWLSLFSAQSLIGRALKEDGYLLLVEDQRIPVGEKAHKYGFIVLDTSHLRTLFSVKTDDATAGRFSYDDKRNDGRLKAHWISKSLLSRMSRESVANAIGQLKETAKQNIKRLRGEDPSYANGQLHGFWTQQFANTSLFLN